MDKDFLPHLHSDCWSRPLFWMEERLALKMIKTEIHSKRNQSIPFYVQ